MSAESDSVGDYYTYGQYGIVTQRRHMICGNTGCGPNYGNIWIKGHIIIFIYSLCVVLNHRGVTILLCCNMLQ